MKKAFTMIELVFVIVVIGILAAAIIPSTRTNPLQEAAIQLVSHIRYTQHLAMLDDTYNRNDASWYKGRWQLVFSDSTYSANVPAYTIFLDRDLGSGYGGDASKSEIAKNPENSLQLMTGGYGIAQAINYSHDNFEGMKKLNLGKSYGVTSVNLDGGCSDSRIVFDYLGRPMKGDMSGNNSAYENDNLVQTNCDVIISDGSESITIRIRPETGYASII